MAEEVVLMSFLLVFILALAVSLDGLVVGITYGLKQIKIGLLSLSIISFASGLTIFLSMNLGKLLLRFISPLWAEKIGGMMLLAIGVYLFYHSLVEFMYIESQGDNSLKEICTFKIKSLGLIISILQEPIKADLDYSGVISSKEAVFLGIALALDAFGAGIAAAMTGYDVFMTPLLVVIFKFIFLTGGMYMGQKIQSFLWNDKIKLIPGLVLIILGMFKIF